jgi:hypothetical protein
VWRNKADFHGEALQSPIHLWDQRHSRALTLVTQGQLGCRWCSDPLRPPSLPFTLTPSICRRHCEQACAPVPYSYASV